MGNQKKYEKLITEAEGVLSAYVNDRRSRFQQANEFMQIAGELRAEDFPRLYSYLDGLSKKNSESHSRAVNTAQIAADQARDMSGNMPSHMADYHDRDVSSCFSDTREKESSIQSARDLVQSLDPSPK